MANTVDKVLKIAENEKGYMEKASNKDLDSKQGNSGSKNYTKYWRDLKPSWQGEPWCNTFLNWIFIEAYGLETAKKMLCTDGEWSYYTPTSANYFKKKNLWKTNKETPKPGDVIFFKNTTRICHVGIVTKVDEAYVYTIEGNTSGASGVISNGGMVFGYKKYKLNYSRIAGYGCPEYDVLKSIEDVAVDVIAGKYGNGESRKEKLEAEGYNYDEVKKVVNELLSKETEKKANTNKTPEKKPAHTTVKDAYTQKEFVKDVQMALGVKQDGIVGPVTLGKTITISTIFNRKHKVVKYIQKYLKTLKFYSGEIDGIYGTKTKAAVQNYQKAKGCTADGVISKKQKTWKSLLGVK